MATKKYTIQDMQELAEIRNGKCLSEKYIRSNIKMRWECSLGHQWEMTYNSLQQGGWCHACAKVRGANARKKKDGLNCLQRLAAKFGGKCLSCEYLGMARKHLWECAEGHRWEAVPSAIQGQGCWCPVCGELIRRAHKRIYTIENMHDLATGRGGKCLSCIFENVNKPLQWQCNEGHVWFANPSDIRDGKWCKICSCKARAAKRIKYTIEDMRKFAQKKGGECLSEYYTSFNGRLSWECANGHKWEAKVSNVIHNGRWCAECRIGRGEKICRTYFEQIFEMSFPKSRPHWLYTSEGRQLELDGYCEVLKIAFEHQGTQHYVYHNYFHGDAKSLERRKIIDQRKKVLCTKAGVTLIEVPSVLEILGVENLKSFIKSSLIEYKITIPANFDTKIIDLSSAYDESTDQLCLKL